MVLYETIYSDDGELYIDTIAYGIVIVVELQSKFTGTEFASLIQFS